MTKQPFSPAGRRGALERMAAEEFDLLIVGGGITGCGLARDAALRGLKVALVEKGDFGSGTSSRSSKLVHGGVRYLAHGEVRLVRESAREREVLRAIAPHLVHRLEFLYPIYGKNLAKFRAGFWLFDRLAGSAPNEVHRLLTAEAVRARLPALREGVTAAVQYGEYITDDARFTLENGLSAAEHGALLANYVQLRSLVLAGGRVCGGMVRDQLAGDEYLIRSRVVVNATGPWAEETLRRGATNAPRAILPSKGVHLLFHADRLPLDGAVALKSPSGFEGFAIRRWGYVYIGTTDVAHVGPLDHPVSDRTAVDQLLGLARDSFPGLGLTEADIVSTWAGLRPLICEPGKAPRDTSRHDEVWRSPEGLLTVAGGKLTTYRPMANRIMAHVARELGRRLPDNRLTAEVALPGAAVQGQPIGSFCDSMKAALTARGVTAEHVERIAWLYGRRMEELLRYGDEDPAWMHPLNGAPALRGEVRLAVEQEMAMTLADFMDRRSALLIFSDDHGLNAADEAAAIMGSLLGWSDEQRWAQVADYRRVVAAHGLPLA